MSRYIKLTTMLLAVTFMVSAFTSLPVRAEEPQTSEALPIETQATTEETISDTTAETAIETTVPSEPSEADATEPSDAVPTLPEEPGLELSSEPGSELSAIYINSIQDLANLLGTENVTILSETDICLKRDVVLPNDFIYFSAGTYNLDFRGFHISNYESVYIEGGNVTLCDSSVSQSGGTVEPDASESYVFVRGGSLTIQSGSYTGKDALFQLKGGALTIEGGRFTASSTGTNWPLIDASSSIYTNAIAYLKITGGYFEMSGANTIGIYDNIQATLSNLTVKSDKAGVFYAGHKDGFLHISSGTFYGAEDGMQIVRTNSAQLSGGTFSSDPSQGGGGIACYSEDLNSTINVFSFFADGYMYDLPVYTSEMLEKFNILHTYTKPKVTVISSKSVEGFVDRLYSKTLDRQPDLKGFQDWITKLKAKTSTGSGVAFGFFFSPEFIKKNVSDTDFVTLMYRVFFDREPDATGKQTWLNALANGASRKYVFAGFANSKEWKSLCDQYKILPGTYASDEARDQNIGVTSFIQRLYTLCLNRKADVAGMNDWAAGLNSKQKDGAHVAYGFFFSTEFTNRKLSNEDYVEVLYKVLLGRASDSKGKADWVAQLKAGKSRLEIFRGFAHSQEFEKICAEYGIVRGTV